MVIQQSTLVFRIDGSYRAIRNQRYLDLRRWLLHHTPTVAIQEIWNHGADPNDDEFEGAMITFRTLNEAILFRLSI